MGSHSSEGSDRQGGRIKYPPSAVAIPSPSTAVTTVSEYISYSADDRTASRRIGGNATIDRDQADEDGGWGETDEMASKRHQRVLNRIMSDIGYGKYQRRMLVLCGLGWLADNMWMQGAVSIMPRVQQEFSIDDSYIGVMMSSMFVGLMMGALFWGPMSDKYGRQLSYRWTLVISGVCGLATSFSSSFFWVCAGLYCVGFGVGGNMPVDGALFLEFVSKENHSLLTLLSIFFSLGSGFAACVAWLIIPAFSCPDSRPDAECDMATQNRGWRYVLTTLAVFTGIMVVLRLTLVKPYESPRFLVQNKRQSDAVVVLREIARYNGHFVETTTEDGMNCDDDDNNNPSDEGGGGNVKIRILSTAFQSIRHRASLDGSDGAISSADIDDKQMADSNREDIKVAVGLDLETTMTELADADTDTDNGGVSSSSSNSNSKQRRAYHAVATSDGPDYPAVHCPDGNDREILPGGGEYHRSDQGKRRIASVVCRYLRSWSTMASHRLDETIAQLQLLFAPDLRRTTILVWLIWALVSLGFTMFNSFLPKMLELHGQGASSSSSSSGDGDGETLAVGMDRSKVYRDALLYALSGIPGSIIGSWAVDTMLGRRYSMALATFGSAICLWVFSRTQSSWGVLVSSAMFGLVSALMYAIVYSYTPEVFSPAVRGTGCGVASALSRVAGIIAPLLAGLLIAWSLVSVLYASMAILVVAGICMVLLPIETAKHDAL